MAAFLGLMTLLSGCGGGGAAAVNPTNPVTPTVVASSVQLLVSSPQMDSAGTSAVDVTVVVLDANSVALASKAVTLKVSDPSGTAFLNTVSGATTDDNGIVTAKLNLGTSKANRAITLTATADATSATNTVDVANTKLAIFSGSSSAVIGAATTFQISLKDSAGTAIPNAPVTITSALGNNLNPSSGTTDSSGVLTVVVTGIVAGTDTLTASAFGATASQTLSIGGSDFTFTAPASGQEFLVNAAHSLNIRYFEGLAPQAGKTVIFSATRGTVSGTCITNTSGSCTTAPTLSSSSTGPSTITATTTGPNGTISSTQAVTFITATASTVSVQASQTTVSVNTLGSTTNRATISAIVRDAANNLVKNANVVFNLTDTTGGTISPASAITDVSGVATTDYIAGATSSAPNSVKVEATVTHVGGAPVAVPSASIELTVGGQSLFVRLASDNTIASNGVTYVKTYAAIVTDAAGNPPTVPVQIVFSLKPRGTPNDAFYKGTYTWVETLTGGAWIRSITAYCKNQDLNYNGIIDAGELATTNENGLKVLFPGNVASVTSPVTTNSSGIANTTITYAKDYAYWTTVTLQATAFVAGTESTSVVWFTLPGLAADYTNKDVSPPGTPSPYGPGTSCFDTN